MTEIFGSFAVEDTPEGEQALVPGVKPIRTKDRLAWLANAPLQSGKQQKGMDFGLFDETAIRQLDLIDVIRAAERDEETK